MKKVIDLLSGNEMFSGTLIEYQDFINNAVSGFLGIRDKS